MANPFQNPFQNPYAPYPWVMNGHQQQPYYHNGYWYYPGNPNPVAAGHAMPAYNPAAHHHQTAGAQGLHTYYYQPAGGAAAPSNVPADGYHHVWYGRSAAQVQNDARAVALRDGAYNSHDIAPADPRPDQQFWVREINGVYSLYPFAAIEALKPGRWQMEMTNGSLVFVRTAA